MVSFTTRSWRSSVVTNRTPHRLRLLGAHRSRRQSLRARTTYLSTDQHVGGEICRGLPILVHDEVLDMGIRICIHRARRYEE